MRGRIPTVRQWDTRHQMLDLLHWLLFDLNLRDLCPQHFLVGYTFVRVLDTFPRINQRRIPQEIYLLHYLSSHLLQRFPYRSRSSVGYTSVRVSDKFLPASQWRIRQHIRYLLRYFLFHLPHQRFLYRSHYLVFVVFHNSGVAANLPWRGPFASCYCANLRRTVALARYCYANHSHAGLATCTLEPSSPEPHCQEVYNHDP